MGGMLIARAFLPTGNHIKQALTYMDLAIKVEIVLHELSNTLFWFSLIEIGLFLLSLLLFFTDPTEMVCIWFHILHCGRGALGLILQSKLPKSHQMAANMSIPNDEKLPFESIMNYMFIAAKDALSEFTTMTKKWLLIYLGSTIVCLFLDLTNFFIQVHGYARVQSAFADLTMVTLASIFLFIDWFYILWIVTLTYKFPPYVSTAFIKSSFGMMEGIHQKLGNFISNSKSRYDFQYSDQQNRYNYIAQQNQQANQQTNQQREVIVNYPLPGSDSQRE